MMLNKVKVVTIASLVLAMGMGVANAKGKPGGGGSSVDFAADMSRIPADALSGSEDSVLDQCGGGVEGWDDARATIEANQNGGTVVEIELKNAKPHTLFTVWLRVKGKSHGVTFGGSPVTGGGATPLAPSSALGQLVADWVGPGSPDQPNGFRTNAKGNGKLQLELDFPLTGGAYPFNRMEHEDHLLAQTKNPDAQVPPTAIADPRDARISGTPFLIRMVSHCQDDTGHGLSPSNRESWFQYP